MVKQKVDPDSLTVIGHLDELRKRVFYCIGYILLCSLIGLFFARHIIFLLKIPSINIIDELIIIRPIETIVVYFKVSVFVGIILASPAVLYHIWKFFEPVFSKKINTSLNKWLLVIALFFVLGIFFAFNILIPVSVKFLIHISEKIAKPMITLNSYISFVLSIMVLAGIVFEMPVISAFLTKLNIISPFFLRKRRKEAVFILFVIGAVLTPTVDIFNMLVFVIPMIILYEISILVSSFIYTDNENTKVEEIYNNE